jgi:hypothetical protein
MNNFPCKKIVIVCLIATLLCSLFCGCAKEDDYITGNEWLLVQKQSLSDLEAYTSGMDEVFSLYIVGGITENDFVAELDLLKQQYEILKKFRSELKVANPVKEGSHSYVSKRGTDALDDYYDTIGELLDYAVNDSGKPLSPDELSYGYMAYQQTLSTSLSEYVTAVVWLEEANKTEDANAK